MRPDISAIPVYCCCIFIGVFFPKANLYSIMVRHVERCYLSYVATEIHSKSSNQSMGLNVHVSDTCSSEVHGDTST